MFIPPRRLALSGGGMKGLAHVGALEELEAAGLLGSVREVVGTSAGALIAFCLCIGYTVAELRTLCTVFEFERIQNLQPEGILQCLETFGLDTRENLDKLLGILLKAKGMSPAITFGELAGRRMQLRVYAADLAQCEPREFSARATPQFPVLLAVAASMAVPIYFTPVTDPETGALLVDGGLVAHFPFHHLSREEREETLGLAFDGSYKTGLLDCSGTASATPFLPFVQQLYFSVYHHQNRLLREEWGHRIVDISCGAFPALHFQATADERLGLMQAGRDAVRAFLSGGRKSPRPPRRYSVS